MLKETKIDPFMAIGATLLIGGLAWQQLTAVPGESPGDKLKAIRHQTAHQQAELIGSAESERIGKDIANQRLKDGCVLVVASASPDKYAMLGSGPVFDSATNQPIPPGTVVCDFNGMTGVADANGIPGKLAFTGDRKRIAERIRINQETGIMPALQSSPHAGGKRL